MPSYKLADGDALGDSLGDALGLSEELTLGEIL